MRWYDFLRKTSKYILPPVVKILLLLEQLALAPNFIPILDREIVGSPKFSLFYLSKLKFSEPIVNKPIINKPVEKEKLTLNDV